MGNICPRFGSGNATQQSRPPTERSSLLYSNTSQQPVTSPPHKKSRGPGGSNYSVVSVPSKLPFSSNSGIDTISFARTSLEVLDKRLKDISNLYNNMLENVSQLQSGLSQLNHLSENLVKKSSIDEELQALGDKTSSHDNVVTVFVILNYKCNKLKNSDTPINIKLKEHGKNWSEIVFDSKGLLFEEINFFNIFNLLARTAWDLQTKVPHLRETIHMTIADEDMFQRELIKVSGGVHFSQACSENFTSLRRIEGHLADFETTSLASSQRFVAASRNLLSCQY